MLAPPEQFTSERLQLRWPELTDADAIYEAYGQDREVTRYLSWRPHVSLDDARVRMRRRLRDVQSGTEFSWIITPRGAEELLGMVSLFPIDHHAELGYVLARAHWGKGYATEAACTVVDWALAQPEIYRIWGVVDVENPASARVLENAGMQREGLLRRFGVHPNTGPEPRDCLLYARVK